MHGDLASWGQRALGGLIDYVAPAVAVVVLVYVVGAAAPGAVAAFVNVLLYLAVLAFTLWNSYQGGVTGQTIGRKYAKVTLIKEETGQPIGGGMGIARSFVHILDSLPCYLGWLAPLVTPKKQTLADMVLGTLVVRKHD